MTNVINSGGPALAMPTPQELAAVFTLKHGPLDTVGWAPRRRVRFGYYLPADVYETVVNKLVTPSCDWLDVGGGEAIFPENPVLARELVARSARVVAVDPSDNVQQNSFVHDRVQCLLEDYNADAQFHLVTLRMVVEHVGSPEKFVEALGRLVKPSGIVVVFTVNLWSPIAGLSWLLPFRMHHPIKKLIWGGDEKDTFPVYYRMNTRAALRRLFTQAGFVEQFFARLDDLSTFAGYRWLNYVELMTRWALRFVGLGYPENCLLGIYRRDSEGRKEVN